MTKDNLLKICGYIDMACAFCYDAETYEQLFLVKHRLCLRFKHLLNDEVK